MRYSNIILSLLNTIIIKPSPPLSYLKINNIKFHNSEAITENSTKLKLVTRSILAAKTVALTDGSHNAFFIASLD